jgi:TusA-related sulfurtransferase
MRRTINQAIQEMKSGTEFTIKNNQVYGYSQRIKKFYREFINGNTTIPIEENSPEYDMMIKKIEYNYCS